MMSWILITISFLAFIAVLIIPFFIYMFLLNRRQAEYFKRFAAHFGLNNLNIPNPKIVRRMPSVAGTVNGIPLKLQASASKSQHFTSAGAGTAVRTRQPVTRIEVGTKKSVKTFTIVGSGRVKTTVVEYLKLGNLSVETYLSVVPEDAEILLKAYVDEYKGIELQYDQNGTIASYITQEMSKEGKYLQGLRLAEVLLALAQAASQ
jgi:hypothetical protein